MLCSHSHWFIYDGYVTQFSEKLCVKAKIIYSISIESTESLQSGCQWIEPSKQKHDDDCFLFVSVHLLVWYFSLSVWYSRVKKKANEQIKLKRQNIHMIDFYQIN